ESGPPSMEQLASDTSSFEGGPPFSAEPHGWGTSMSVSGEFQRARSPQKPWEGNDLNDVIALAIAVPYCDVVVTEKSWASLVNAAKVGKRFNTLVTRNINDVVDRLSEGT
uniref:hypothetical protein n=1 Tax=Mycolicibacterium vinylchloridicum TaxID=2736928 RepID=UPI001C54523B